MRNPSPEFKPGLSHPFYFMRRGLYVGISRQAAALRGRMMDFGCGTKPYRSLFDVEEYTGVDFDNSGHPHAGEEIDIFYDGHSLPFPNGYFDSILSSEVFEHIFNLPDMLAELNRVMKMKGKMIITCPFVWNEHEVPFDFARYTRFALKHLLESRGFHVISEEKAGTFIQAIFQSWNLYWYSVLSSRARKRPVIRWTMKYLLFTPINIMGRFFNWLLPRNQSMYLSNIVLAEKIGEYGR